MSMLIIVCCRQQILFSMFICNNVSSRCEDQFSTYQTVTLFLVFTFGDFICAHQVYFQAVLEAPSTGVVPRRASLLQDVKIHPHLSRRYHARQRHKFALCPYSCQSVGELQSSWDPRDRVERAVSQSPSQGEQIHVQTFSRDRGTMDSVESFKDLQSVNILTGIGSGPLLIHS